MQTLEVHDDLGPLFKLPLQVHDSALGGGELIVDVVNWIEPEDVAMVGIAFAEIVVLALLQNCLEDPFQEMGEHRGCRERALWDLKECFAASVAFAVDAAACIFLQALLQACGVPDLDEELARNVF